MSAHWIAVASAEHVRRGREAGFMQVNHGKAAPLRRIKPGDGIVYYSPTTILAREGRPAGFHRDRHRARRRALPRRYGRRLHAVPARRGMGEGEEAPIKPLLEQLDFTAGKSNWGYQLRFGLFEIGEHDFQLIAEAMGVKVAKAA